MGRHLGSKNKVSKMIEVKCKFCNKKFKIYPYRKNNIKYCSHSCKMKDRQVKDSTKKKLSKLMKKYWKDGKLKGKPAWNKGTKGIMKAWNKGLKGYNKNYPRNKKWCKKISKANKGIKCTDETRKKMCKAQSKRILDCKKIIEKGIFKKGENHPNWNNGSSLEKYGYEFNKKLKKKIRKRDNFICQECGKVEKELKRKLCIHHIDYNKKNNEENNLISLCLICHLKTNFKREDWKKYFQNKIYELY